MAGSHGQIQEVVRGMSYGLCYKATRLMDEGSEAIFSLEAVTNY